MERDVKNDSIGHPESDKKSDSDQKNSDSLRLRNPGYKTDFFKVSQIDRKGR